MKIFYKFENAFFLNFKKDSRLKKETWDELTFLLPCSHQKSE